MELKSYIESAEKKAGSQKKLSDILGISAGYIRMAKGEKRGFPEAICIKLADYLDEDRLSVIAASGLVTEKDQERRKILESCFRKVASVAAVAVVTSILTLAPQQIVKAETFTPEFTKIQIIRNWFLGYGNPSFL